MCKDQINRLNELTKNLILPAEHILISYINDAENLLDNTSATTDQLFFFYNNYLNIVRNFLLNTSDYQNIHLLLANNSELSSDLRESLINNLHMRSHTKLRPSEKDIQGKIQTIKAKIQKLKAAKKSEANKTIKSFEEALQEYESSTNEANSPRDLIFEGLLP